MANSAVVYILLSAVMSLQVVRTTADRKNIYKAIRATAGALIVKYWATPGYTNGKLKQR